MPNGNEWQRVAMVATAAIQANEEVRRRADELLEKRKEVVERKERKIENIMI